MTAYQIEHYLTAEDREDLYLTWLIALRDRQAKVAIIRRVNRIEQGNFGDHKFCRDGVWELRVDLGPGYRVYYAPLRQLIVLLCGGDKRTQRADIDRAVSYWQAWRLREDDEKQST